VLVAVIRENFDLFKEHRIVDAAQGLAKGTDECGGLGIEHEFFKIFTRDVTLDARARQHVLQKDLNHSFFARVGLVQQILYRLPLAQQVSDVRLGFQSFGARRIEKTLHEFRERLQLGVSFQIGFQ
jgi:hypothetical protein